MAYKNCNNVFPENNVKLLSVEDQSKTSDYVIGQKWQYIFLSFLSLSFSLFIYSLTALFSICHSISACSKVSQATGQSVWIRPNLFGWKFKSWRLCFEILSWQTCPPLSRNQRPLSHAFIFFSVRGCGPFETKSPLSHGGRFLAITCLPYKSILQNLHKDVKTFLQIDSIKLIHFKPQLNVDHLAWVHSADENSEMSSEDLSSLCIGEVVIIHNSSSNCTKVFEVSEKILK